MSTIVLRADGSAGIGSGHLRRCLTLARAITQAGGQPVLLARRLDASAEAILGQAPCPVHWLPSAPAPAAPEIDAADTADALVSLQPGWVLVDHYQLDARWHREVARRTGCRIAVLDDLADRAIDADLVIDPNWHADPNAKFEPVLARPAHLLAGPRFALLDDAYREHAPYAFSEAVRSIGIFLGGTDPASWSAGCLQACRAAGFDGPVEIVSTSANPNLEALREAVSHDPAVTLTLDLPELSAFFARHDLQIGAGGGASWERCCMAAPTLALQVADNQLSVLPALDAMGALRWVRAGSDDLVQALAQEIRALRNDPAQRLAMSRAASTLVDGWGAHRIAGWLCADSLALHARAATADDEALLLRWANDAGTRAASFSSRAIAPEEHHRWLAARLAAPDQHRLMILCAAAGLPVGHVRFDHVQANQWRINYAIEPDLRGRGLASRALQVAADALAASTPQPPEPLALVGDVKADNLPSRRAFERLGFQASPAPEGHIVYSRDWPCA